MVSSYCSVVTLDAGVKRARILVLRASVVADGTVVAIGGLLRVDAPGRADLQPNASCCARLASEDSEPEGTTQRITSLARLRGVPLRKARSLEGVIVPLARGWAGRGEPRLTGKALPSRVRDSGGSRTSIRRASNDCGTSSGCRLRRDGGGRPRTP